MWKGLFGGKWTSKQDDRSRRTSPLQHQRYSRQTDDREEDGFVLVGETAIERSTVGPVRVTSSSYLDAPPSYESQVNRSSYNPLASYTPLFSSLNMGQNNSNIVTTEISPVNVVASSSDSSHTGESTVESTSSTTLSPPSDLLRPTTGFSYVSTLPGEIIEEETFICPTPRAPDATTEVGPLGGVPFKLAKWLQAMDTDWSAYDCLTIPNINIADFEYDFSLERSALRVCEPHVRMM